MNTPAIWSSMLSWCTPAVLFVLLNVAIATIFFFSNPQKHEPKQTHHPLRRTSSLYETFKSFNLYRQNTQELTHTPINPPPHEPEPQLTRTSSIFDTLKSFNPYHQNTLTQDPNYINPPPHQPEPRQLTRTSSIFDTLKSFNPYHQNTLTQDPTIDPPPHQPEPHQLTRTSSLLEALKSFSLYRQNTQNTQDLTTTLQDPKPIGTVEKSEPHEQSHFLRNQSDIHPTAGEVPEKLSHKMKKSASEKSPFDHFGDEGVVSDSGPLTERIGPVTRGDEGVDAKADDFINRFKQQLKLQRLDSILRYKEMLSRGK